MGEQIEGSTEAEELPLPLCEALPGEGPLEPPALGFKSIDRYFAPPQFSDI